MSRPGMSWKAVVRRREESSYYIIVAAFPLAAQAQAYIDESAKLDDNYDYKLLYIDPKTLRNKWSWGEWEIRALLKHPDDAIQEDK